MKRRFAVALALIIAIALVGCENPDEADETSDNDEAEAQEAETDETDEAAEEDEEAAAPRAKETNTVADEDLGTSPEDVALEVGSAVPELTIDTTDGEGIALNELADEQPLLVFFYRGGWCPFCNFQIREMTTNYEKFSEQGVELAAISVDQVEEAAKTDEAYEIPFPVFSDPDLEAHEAFEVVYKAEPEEAEKLAEMGMDLEAASGRDHNSYAIPAVFLIVDGEVVWAHADLDYQRRPSVDQLVDVIDENLEQ